MVAECSQISKELEKLVLIACYYILLYSVFFFKVLFYLYLWTYFLSGMLIETLFINMTCVHAKHGGCALTKATGNFKQKSQECYSCPGLKYHWAGTECCACKVFVLENLLFA